jgi:hypothetical protein
MTALLVTASAAASVSIAVSFDDLVSRSTAVAVVVPVEQRSVWEGRHIITYTRAHVDDAVAGAADNGADVWIATRGGAIGDIGQVVDGEPVLRVGRPALVFLREDILDDKPAPASGVFVVTARAQGFFPIEKEKRLASSVTAGLLLPPIVRVPMVAKPLAREFLHDKPLAEGRAAIVAAWERLHPRSENPANQPRR